MKIKILFSTITAMTLLIFSAGTVTAQSMETIVPSLENESTDSTQSISDTVITTKVKAELAITEGIKSNDISVETNNGVVTLTGTQPDETLIKKAEAVAQSVKDVVRVDISGLTVDATPAN